MDTEKTSDDSREFGDVIMDFIDGTYNRNIIQVVYDSVKEGIEKGTLKTAEDVLLLLKETLEKLGEKG